MSKQLCVATPKSPSSHLLYLFSRPPLPSWLLGLQQGRRGAVILYLKRSFQSLALKALNMNHSFGDLVSRLKGWSHIPGQGIYCYLVGERLGGTPSVLNGQGLSGQVFSLASQTHPQDMHTNIPVICLCPGHISIYFLPLH